MLDRKAVIGGSYENAGTTHNPVFRIKISRTGIFIQPLGKSLTGVLSVEFYTTIRTHIEGLTWK